MEKNKNKNKIKNIYPKKEINMSYKGIKKMNKINKFIMEHNIEYQMLKSEKEEKEDESESDEENKKISKINMVKDALISSYLNTINIGSILPGLYFSTSLFFCKNKFILSFIFKSLDESNKS